MQIHSMYDKKTGAFSQALVNIASIKHAPTRDFVLRRGKPVAKREGWYRLTAHAFAQRPMDKAVLRHLAQKRKAALRAVA